MKLNLDFPNLFRLARQMQAEIIPWKVQGPSLDARVIDDIDLKLKKGIELTLDQVGITPEGLLHFQGRPVLLYIMDTNQDRFTLEFEPEKARRFHVADCQTLEDMRNKDRFFRYVATNNVSGRFKVKYYERMTDESGETYANLKVCKNCLKRLNYQGYENSRVGAKKTIWKGFSIEEFFNHYSSHFRELPRYTAENPPSFEYSDDWDKISHYVREQRGWKCEACGLDLSEPAHHKLLQVHHINGVKSDNSLTNLKALCLDCHSKQPLHSNMCVKPEDRRLIYGLRFQQRDRRKT